MRRAARARLSAENLQLARHRRAGLARLSRQTSKSIIALCICDLSLANVRERRMFYSHNILTRKGGSLGLVWYETSYVSAQEIVCVCVLHNLIGCRIAANFQPGVHHISLTRREYCSVSISKAW